MKGYSTYAGYMGWIPTSSRYMLFANEGDYEDYYNDILEKE